jgi:hypothetical protein
MTARGVSDLRPLPLRKSGQVGVMGYDSIWLAIYFPTLMNVTWKQMKAGILLVHLSKTCVGDMEA